MAWSYDPTNLDTSTASGRLNTVRLLVGDTDTNDQQVQDEEITFALSQESDKVYAAASWVAKTLAAKFARYVDVDLDGQLEEKYSQLQKHYSALSKQLESLDKESSASLGVSAGGINKTIMRTNRRLPNRPEGFYIGQYDNDEVEGDEYC